MKIMKSRTYAFIKIFDKEEYADAFLQHGVMRCGTLGEFKGIGDEDRGDKYEGVMHWNQPDQITLKITYKDEDGVEKTLPITELAGPVIMQDGSFDRLNLYCIYALKIPEFVETYETEEERVASIKKTNAMLAQCCVFSDEVLRLGRFAVVVYQVVDFINAVTRAAAHEKLAYAHGHVGYFDPDTFNGSFEGVVGAFRKRKTYEHQSEYRFCFQSQDEAGVRFLRLGSLAGMAFKTSTGKLNEMFQIKVDEDLGSQSETA